MISSIGSSSTYYNSVFSQMKVTKKTTQKSSDTEGVNPDTNGDGVIDSSELASLASKIKEKTGKEITTEELVTKLDTDGDGKVTTGEMDEKRKSKGNMPPPPPGRMQGPPMQGGGPKGVQGAEKPNFDTNGDGVIDEKDLESFVSKIEEASGEDIDTSELFKKLDADSNGELDDTELEQMRTLLPPPPPPQGMNRMGMNQEENIGISEIDTDSDSKISKAEYSNFAAKLSEVSNNVLNVSNLFSTLDENSDEYLDEEEQKEAVKKINKYLVSKFNEAYSVFAKNSATNSDSITQTTGISAA